MTTRRKRDGQPGNTNALKRLLRYTDRLMGEAGGCAAAEVKRGRDVVRRDAAYS